MSDLIQDELIEDFSFFDDWMDRYQQLIDMGKTLPELSEDELDDVYLLKGCQSRVWLLHEFRDGRLYFRAASDSAIVSGLIALMLKIYNDRTASEIIGLEPYFIREIGLDHHLSPTRKNGLESMLRRIKETAGMYIENDS